MQAEMIGRQSTFTCELCGFQWVPTQAVDMVIVFVRGKSIFCTAICAEMDEKILKIDCQKKGEE